MVTSLPDLSQFINKSNGSFTFKLSELINFLRQYLIKSLYVFCKCMEYGINRAKAWNKQSFKQKLIELTSIDDMLIKYNW